MQLNCGYIVGVNSRIKNYLLKNDNHMVTTEYGKCY